MIEYDSAWALEGSQRWG